MPEWINTGGEKRFKVSDENLEDTESTREFKEALKKYYDEKRKHPKQSFKKPVPEKYPEKDRPKNKEKHAISEKNIVLKNKIKDLGNLICASDSCEIKELYDYFDRGERDRIRLSSHLTQLYNFIARENKSSPKVDDIIKEFLQLAYDDKRFRQIEEEAYFRTVFQMQKSYNKQSQLAEAKKPYRQQQVSRKLWDKGKKKHFRDSSHIIKKFAIAIIIFIVLLGAYIYSTQDVVIDTVENEVVTGSKNVTSEVKVFDKVSLANFFKNRENMHKEIVRLTGYITEIMEGESVKIQKIYLVDDYDNKVELRVPKDQRLTINFGEEVYEVQGEYNKFWRVIAVSNIFPATKDFSMKEITHPIQLISIFEENITVKRYKLWLEDVQNLTNKVKEKSLEIGESLDTYSEKIDDKTKDVEQILSGKDSNGCDKSSEIFNGSACISKYKTGAKDVMFDYVLNGNREYISVTVYGGLNDYLASRQRSIMYYEGESAPTRKDFILRNINEENQLNFIEELIKGIKSKSSDPDEQAKIAISLVQNIPYDYTGLYSGNLNSKYPYEVLYTQSGVCGEKTELTIILLRELGFATAYLEFDTENHAVAGVKCPSEYDYRDSGYCFVETTSPTIITYAQGQYVGAGYLTSKPVVIEVSDGNSLENIGEEAVDAKVYDNLINKGLVLSQNDYNKWLRISEKYGLKT